MKQLKDYKEEIHRCSKCGICQHACPVYQETGNDCTVSRGQFIMLEGVIKGDLKLNKNINKYLDLCLKCGKCKSACPTGIDAVDIILSAKHEYFKNSLEGKIYSFLESKFVFNNILNLIGKIRNIRRKKKLPKLENPIAKVIYFGGCIEKLHPEVRDYVVELLHKMNIEVLDVKFDCCGIPFLTTGNLERFEEQTKENLSKLEGLKFDYIVTDCASCEYILSKYWGENIKNIYQIIAESDLKFRTKKHQVITYHKPCHETGEDYINEIISRCENIEFKKLDGYDECCGFAGLEHPLSLKVISKIMRKKSQNINKVDPDYVLTSCVGCLAGMGVATLFRRKIRRLLTFLKDECEISSK